MLFFRPKFPSPEQPCRPKIQCSATAPHRYTLETFGDGPHGSIDGSMDGIQTSPHEGVLETLSSKNDTCHIPRAHPRQSPNYERNPG